MWLYTEKELKLNGKAGGGVVSIITESKDKMYIISFFKRRRLAENSLSRTGINSRGLTFLIGIRRYILNGFRKFIYEWRSQIQASVYSYIKWT